MSPCGGKERYGAVDPTVWPRSAVRTGTLRSLSPFCSRETRNLIIVVGETVGIRSSPVTTEGLGSGMRLTDARFT